MTRKTNELDRLKPLLSKEAKKRNENTCIFYDYATQRTDFARYKDACELENDDKGYIVLVAFVHDVITDSRVDEIMEGEPTDEEMEELVDWVIQVNEEFAGRKK